MSVVITRLSFGGLATFSASLLFPPMIHAMAAAAQLSQQLGPAGSSLRTDGQTRGG